MFRHTFHSQYQWFGWLIKQINNAISRDQQGKAFFLRCFRYLSNNKIDDISSGAFHDVSTSQDIYLTGNPLKYLHTKSFNGTSARYKPKCFSVFFSLGGGDGCQMRWDDIFIFYIVIFATVLKIRVAIPSKHERCWPNVYLMLGQRRRRWTNNKSTLCQHFLVTVGNAKSNNYNNYFLSTTHIYKWQVGLSLKIQR